MSLTRAIFQNVTLLLGLVAVFLGALEHEDLILQEDRLENAGTAERRGAGGHTSRVLADLPDSGTESTFRQELDAGQPFRLPRIHPALLGDVRASRHPASPRQVMAAAVLAPGARDIPLRL